MKAPRVIFLSHIINERSPLYGGKGRVILKREKSIKKGDSCNTMLWSFSNHTGTHIDLPAHFIDNGKSVCGLSPADLIFKKPRLITLKNVEAGRMIGPDDLAGARNCDLLFIKTGLEKYRNKAVYWKDSVALAPSLAGWLKKRCPALRAVGIDSISISNLNKRETGRQAHEAFLGRGILLIEDMKLGGLRSDPDMVIAAPMLVEGADASPCTVLGIYN